MVSHTFITSDISCSTRHTARPSAASARTSRPNSMVSCSVWPAAGSSSSSTVGWIMRARASSTRRAWPVGSSLTSRSATSANPTSASTRSVSAAAFNRGPPAQPLRISPATRTLSRTDRDVNSSSRWNVRATPRLARRCGGSLEMSRPSRATRPEVAESSPVTTLNSVVLPAPFGPMSPVTRAGSTVSDTPPSASLPPNRT